MRKPERILSAIAIVALIILSSSVPFLAAADNAAQGKQTDADGGIVGEIPPDSPFAKISIGMSMQHVFDLIGRPTDIKYFMTGKSFIPFYHGSDSVRAEALYKGLGRIIFTGRSAKTVYRIVYDPNESGYSDSK